MCKPPRHCQTVWPTPWDELHLGEPAKMTRHWNSSCLNMWITWCAVPQLHNASCGPWQIANEYLLDRSVSNCVNVLFITRRYTCRCQSHCDSVSNAGPLNYTWILIITNDLVPELQFVISYNAKEAKIGADFFFETHTQRTLKPQHTQQSSKANPTCGGMDTSCHTT